MEDILWNRLTTAYVRATEFPKYFSIIESMESKKNVKNSTRRGIEKYRASKYIMESNAFCYDIFRTHISKAVLQMDKNDIAYDIVKELLRFF